MLAGCTAGVYTYILFAVGRRFWNISKLLFAEVHDRFLNCEKDFFQQFLDIFYHKIVYYYILLYILYVYTAKQNF